MVVVDWAPVFLSARIKTGTFYSDFRSSDFIGNMKALDNCALICQGDLGYFRSSAWCVHVYYVYMYMHVDVLACTVGVELDYVFLCEMNVGER